VVTTAQRTFVTVNEYIAYNHRILINDLKQTITSKFKFNLLRISRKNKDLHSKVENNKAESSEYTLKDCD